MKDDKRGCKPRGNEQGVDSSKPSGQGSLTGSGLSELLSQEMSRRGFMRLAAGAGLMLGAGHMFEGCGGGNGGGQEARTYYFELAHADPAKEYKVVAGERRYLLMNADSAAVARFRAEAPRAEVADAGITHYISDALFPSDTHQLCYVEGVEPGSSAWRVESMFIHFPRAFEPKIAAIRAERAACCGTATQGRNFPAATSARPEVQAPAGANYCLETSDLQNDFDTAKTLIFQHPDIMSLDTNTAAYVLENIICSRPETWFLANSIHNQMQNGGSWAVHTPILDDDGKPYRSSEGKDQYAITWTEETSLWVGRAALGVLKAIKNDTSLGANVTDRTSADLTAGTNTDLTGKLWLMRDGVPYVDHSSISGISGQTALLQSRARADASGIRYTLTNQSTERGFNIPSMSVDPVTRKVTIVAHNWFVRYLGLYVRYLDANGTAFAPPEDIKQSLSEFQTMQSGEYDTYWGLIEPEMVVMGIPVKDTYHTFSFPVPNAASSSMIVAGGLGTGKTDYPRALLVGTCATVILNLAIPTLFLMSSACSAYSGFIGETDSSTVNQIAITFAPILDIVAFGVTNDPKAFLNLATAVAGVLVRKLFLAGLKMLATKLLSRIAAGAVVNALPFVGSAISAIAACGMAAQIGQTVGQVIASPKTYGYKMAFTHDVTVTIHHDPQDTSGFPATAATYEVIALLDKSTTRSSGRLPVTSRGVTQISYTFTGLPHGGKAKYSVGFYAENGWVAGQGQTEEMDNLSGSAEITITENLVPLNERTFYWHLQKTTVSPSEALVWSGNHQSPAPAPMAKKNSLSCANLDGSLCEVGNITTSETYAALGFSWRSVSSGISSCGGSGSGQLYQFRTLSRRDNPEISEISSCGSLNPFRVVFSLIGEKNDNYYLDRTSGTRHIRQIRFTAPGGPASYDGPASNRSFGRLNLDSDDLLFGPLRRLYSINRNLSIFEILDLPEAAGSDSDAPVATTASGEGNRTGLILNPTCAAMTAKGTILVLEAGNRRVQAFDSGVNPAKVFSNKTEYSFPLKTETEGVEYLDMAVEYAGYIYILSYGTDTNVYRLDIYTPQGAWLSRTANVNAGALTIDFWRNVYTLNYEAVVRRGITHPSVSLWIPSVPNP